MNPIIPALVGIGGIVIGSICTYLFQNMLFKRQAILKIAEKVIDKRLKAYDKIYEIAKKLRLMIQVGVKEHEDPNERIIRKPYILSDQDKLLEFMTEMNDTYNRYSQWYSIELTRTYNYYQDYIINCSNYFFSLGNNTEDFSIAIKIDFINLGKMFDKAILKFYTRDCYKIEERLDSDDWHKLPRTETEKKLFETELFRLYLNPPKE